MCSMLNATIIKPDIISCQYLDYQQKNGPRLPLELRTDPYKNDCYTHTLRNTHACTQ